MSGQEDITGLLLDWGSGNRQALDKVTLWCTTNYAIWPGASFAANARIIPCKAQPWFTKLI